MIVLGVILLIVGYTLPVPPIIGTLGLILFLVGVVLFALGAAGRPIAGRRYWY